MKSLPSCCTKTDRHQALTVEQQKCRTIGIPINEIHVGHQVSYIIPGIVGHQTSPFEGKILQRKHPQSHDRVCWLSHPCRRLFLAKTWIILSVTMTNPVCQTSLEPLNDPVALSSRNLTTGTAGQTGYLIPIIWYSTEERNVISPKKKKPSVGEIS